jgi:SAM-dependent methyltransferase
VNRSHDKEMMDMPGQPKELLEDDLRNLRMINRRLGNYRSVVRGLDAWAGAQRIDRFSLLDIGTGSGDIPAVIARWARRKGMAAEISALEPEPVTAAQAAIQTRAFPEITIVQGDGMAPPFRAASFDVVLASQLLHHFSEENIVVLLRTWSKLARRAIIVSDLVRHPLAYYGIRLLTRLFTRNPMTRFDAPLSVKRAFTLAEWRALFNEANVGPVQIFSAFPFRVMALIFPKG